MTCLSEYRERELYKLRGVCITPFMFLKNNRDFFTSALLFFCGNFFLLRLGHHGQSSATRSFYFAKATKNLRTNVADFPIPRDDGEEKVLFLMPKKLCIDKGCSLEHLFFRLV